MKNCLILFFLMFGFTSFATHIVGGEISYDTLGNDQYEVRFEIYRDCGGSDFDNPLQYTVFNPNGSVVSEYTIALPSPDTLSVFSDNPCVTPPNDVCIARAIYIDTITMPATPGGYYITYQRCCWANNIQNITTPGDWGLTLTIDVPGTDLVGNADNHSARFSNYPPIVLCSNYTLTFDHSAVDPDGDSLVYSMCSPKSFNGGGTFVFEPNPEDPAPYTNAPWVAGFSGTQPYGPGSSVTIDSQTGLMNITPNQLGTFVAAVCVQEYRDGVLINEKMRIFGYRVVVCDIEIPIEVSLLGAGELIEGCSSAGFIIERDDTTTALTVGISTSGSATNGIDYNFIPDSITIPVGVSTDTITIFPIEDVFIEGNETVEFSVIVENPCEDDYDTTTASLTIVDYLPMGINVGDSLNLCDEYGEYGTLWAEVGFGLPPYDYYWEPTNYANNDTITFPATDLAPNLNLMYVVVTDACNKQIISDPIPVLNQCPCQVPNVITMNGDGINDTFIIKNVNDYDRVHLKIFNRWGNLVFEDEDYENDWQGHNMNGKELTEGVYTYLVQPLSEKFEYDDAKRSLYTAHGFVHIVK